jgi:hypothetical protein
MIEILKMKNKPCSIEQQNKQKTYQRTTEVIPAVHTTITGFCLFFPQALLDVHILDFS